MYGVTDEGGKRYLGTVYEVSTKGAARLLYSFATETLAGYKPEAGLYYDDGWLYGTTNLGGYGDRGTIYRVRPSGTKGQTLYDFAGSPDGKRPKAVVTSLDGIFYGTTALGGSSGKCVDCGTVWRLKL